jgi:hypothetical protein
MDHGAHIFRVKVYKEYLHYLNSEDEDTMILLNVRSSHKDTSNTTAKNLRPHRLKTIVSKGCPILN